MIRIGVELKDEQLPYLYKGDFLLLSLERFVQYSRSEKTTLFKWLEDHRSALQFTCGNYLFSNQEDEEVLRERFLFIPIQTESLSLRFSKAQVYDLEFMNHSLTRLFQLQAQWEELNQKSLLMRLNFGEQAQEFYEFKNSTSFRLQVDPLWRISSDLIELSDQWIIQGKHPDRWIRYYSKNQLKELAERAKQRQSIEICFAHSKRWEQLMEFQKML